MDNKVRRTLVLLAVAAALFTIAEFYAATPWMIWVRGASAGIALAGVIGAVMIFGEKAKG